VLWSITDMSVIVEPFTSKIGEQVRISGDTLAKVHQMDVVSSHNTNQTEKHI
jgi:hypothetical protein